MSAHLNAKEKTAEKWRLLIDEWQSSGEKASAFCRRKAVSASGFYHWKGKLLGKRDKCRIAALSTNQFVPVSIESALPSNAVAKPQAILYYPNGCHLAIHSEISAKLLSALQKSLGVSTC